MLTVEKEMIGILFNGAANRVENLQISFVLISWSVSFLEVLRMVRHEKETQEDPERNIPENRDPVFERPARFKKQHPAQSSQDDGSRLKPFTKRRN